jgi:hypothetical protein
VFFVASSAVGNLALPHLGKIVPVRHIPRLISGFFTQRLLPLAIPQNARLIICTEPVAVCSEPSNFATVKEKLRARTWLADPPA